MFQYIWPAILIVFSNVVYNLVAKSTPQGANSFLSLSVTYLVGGIFTFIMYLMFHEGSLSTNLKQLNITSVLLGFAIVGLEAGYLYLYRAGWKISMGSLVVNIALAVILLVIGVFFFREQISAKQITGIAFCVIGLVFLNI